MLKSIGQFLQEHRLKQEISLTSLSLKTKIRLDYLEAIEQDKFSKLPSATFTKGFIRNYALAIGVDPNTALAIFRRDFDQNQQGKVIPRTMTEPIVPQVTLFNPRTTSIIIAVIMVGLVLLYVGFQLASLSQAPSLTLTSPGTTTLTNSIITVEGKTSTDATVTINSQPVATNSQGEFTLTVDLAPGDHTLVIKSTSRDGKTRTLTRLITVSPPEN